MKMLSHTILVLLLMSCLGKVRGVQGETGIEEVVDGKSTPPTTTPTTHPKIGDAHDPDRFVSSVGMKTYSALNQTMSNLTGIASTNPRIQAAYADLKSSLPNANELNKYNASAQKAVALLAAEYCNEFKNTPARYQEIVPGLSASSINPQAIAEGFVRNFWGREDIAFQNEAIKEFLITINSINSGAGNNTQKLNKIVFSTCLGTLSSLPIWML